MLVNIYYKPSLFNAHTMILIVHIFMNVNKPCLNQQYAGSSPACQPALHSSLGTRAGPGAEVKTREWVLTPKTRVLSGRPLQYIQISTNWYWLLQHVTWCAFCRASQCHPPVEWPSTIPEAVAPHAHTRTHAHTHTTYKNKNNKSPCSLWGMKQNWIVKENADFAFRQFDTNCRPKI